MGNRLSDETSPYLLEHAGNPVDWQPWDEKALALARDTGKPILLSIGYSACHWCHVMAHESFEDPSTAALMNELYVNIKVDREERPDLDRIYQTAHQLLTGRGGGWPLTVFLTPDEHTPIFAGTYFPKDRRYGMPSFVEVLQGIASYARSEGHEVRERGRSLIRALDSLDAADDDFGAVLDATPIAAACARLAQSFDARNGGFGAAPKFPHASFLEFLLEIPWRRPRAAELDRDALSTVTISLTRMARSGLFDHIGGGFFRYCVDAEWTIPHFEKMLYDNAALLALYADAYAVTNDAEYRRVALATADWVVRDMQADDGTYYATLDADSEGQEGKFYVWTQAEIELLLDDAELRIARESFGLTKAANFEHQFWHLTERRSLEDAAKDASLGLDTAASALERARGKLLDARNARIWPRRDEKRLTAWNGLMIGALAKAARRLGRDDLVRSAARAVDSLRARSFVDGRLFAVFKDGRARFPAYLDDYAFLTWGLLELLQARWRTSDLLLAIDLIETLLGRFEDPRGGFFFTADDHEQLIHRPKPLADEAVPAGNAIAALVLQHFGHLLGEARYLDAATATLRAATAGIERYPEAHASLLRALANELEPPSIVVVRGEPRALASWQHAFDARYAPGTASFFIPDDADDLPGLLADRAPGTAVTAYYCEGTQCQSPVTSLEDLERLMLSSRTVRT